MVGGEKTIGCSAVFEKPSMAFRMAETGQKCGCEDIEKCHRDGVIDTVQKPEPRRPEILAALSLSDKIKNRHELMRIEINEPGKFG